MWRDLVLRLADQTPRQPYEEEDEASPEIERHKTQTVTQTDPAPANPPTVIAVQAKRSQALNDTYIKRLRRKNEIRNDD